MRLWSVGQHKHRWRLSKDHEPKARLYYVFFCRICDQQCNFNKTALRRLVKGSV